MKKNSRKNAFHFYKLEFDEKIEKGIFDSAYDSWRVKLNIPVMFFSFMPFCSSENDVTAT